MKFHKFFSQIFVISFVLSGFVSTAGALSYADPSPTPDSSQTKSINSFELFWPISAGLVEGDKLYVLKTFKENLREVFIFNNLKKAEYNMTLSEKRTVEAEKLLINIKDYQNAKKTLLTAKLNREKVQSLLKKAKEQGKNVIDQKNRMISSFENQIILLNYIATQVPEDQKSAISENVSSLRIILESIK